MLDNNKFVFFLPIALKAYFVNTNIRVLFYPIEILNFEKNILKERFQAT